MKCVIPGTNCKILARAIHALAKIGEEMWVQPREKSLSFRSVSMSSSAYSDFTFHDNFFSSYTFGNLVEEDALKCKISMRSALMVFKSPAMIDKLIETCHVRLEPNADTLIFIFKFRNSVNKTFLLPIIDCEALQVVYTQDNVPNKLVTKSRVLTDAVHNFQQNLVEITIEATAQKLLMRNYVDETSTIANETRTQLSLTIAEFDEYKVNLDSRITFSMKDLRAMLTFAETVGLSISISFESPGKPVVFDVKNVAFEGNFVLSTLNPDGDDNSMSTVQRAKQSARKRTNTASRTSAKSSFKRPNNKSIVSNTSVQPKLLISTRSSETDSPNDPMNIEAAESDTHSTEMNGSSLKTRVLPENGKKLTEKSASIDSAKKRSHFIEAASTSGASSSTSSNRLNSKNADVIRDKELHHSIFSPAWRRKANNDNIDHMDLSIDVPMDEPINKSNNTPMDIPEDPMDEDLVPNSPPVVAKKAKLIFKKCFQSTFDPRMLPGHDTILAEDSDEDNY